MRIPFHLVDVFTDTPLAGNQLCVIPDAPRLSPEVMRAIALEIGFSETTFVTEVSPSRYGMRIFTPATELPFAGHPSLGTAFVLASQERIAPSVTQVVAAGEFPIEVDLEASVVWMRQLPPRFGPRPDAESVAAALNLTEDDLDPDGAAEVVSTGLPHLIAPVRDPGVVGRAAPNLPALANLLQPLQVDGRYLFAREDGGVKARLFAPAIGVAEDAATGSAAGPLGAYLVRHGLVPQGRIVISQGIELRRPGTLMVEVRGEDSDWEVSVGGGVVKVGEGVFDLPL